MSLMPYEEAMDERISESEKSRRRKIRKLERQLRTAETVSAGYEIRYQRAKRTEARLRAELRNVEL